MVKVLMALLRLLYCAGGVRMSTQVQHRQAWSLSAHLSPLCEQDEVAWVLGPVCKELPAEPHIQARHGG